MTERFKFRLVETLVGLLGIAGSYSGISAIIEFLRTKSIISPDDKAFGPCIIMAFIVSNAVYIFLLTRRAFQLRFGYTYLISTIASWFIFSVAICLVYKFTSPDIFAISAFSLRIFTLLGFSDIISVLISDIMILILILIVPIFTRMYYNRLSRNAKIKYEDSFHI